VNLTFASIADDDTGATDIAGMLAAEGMRAIVVLDSASVQELEEWTSDANALVLAIASRALTPKEAYEKTSEASKLIRTLKPRCVGVKYCSTFDSTPAGNIGPSIDAAMDVLEQSFTVAVPAFPINGRTTYLGHHFVGQQLLSESPMRNHPLSPMTNSDLVSHLQSQTRRRVGLATHPAVRAGVVSLVQELKKLRQQGVEIAIIDCISDADLEVIADAVGDMRLITGSSGYATALPRVWKRLGFWSENQRGDSIVQADTNTGTLVIAGSCSEATRSQSRALEATGVRSFVLNGKQLASEDFDRAALIDEIVSVLKSGKNAFLRTMTGEEHVREVQQWASATGFDRIAIGLKVSSGLGKIAKEVIAKTLPQGLIVAGGETSGVVCRILGMKALRVGRNLVPGVPLCASLTAPLLPLVLKSGNFGGDDFFHQAIEVIRSCPQPEKPAGKYVS
jgi:3-dehydrotetronate 4-kinase